jgi:argininosuccinate synthase
MSEQANMQAAVPGAKGRKVVLGFSGGLDTSFCVKYLSEDKEYEVHSIVVNTGGFTDDELKKIEAHAYALGVKSHTTVDAVKTYYDRIIKYLVYGNVLKNNTYPLSVSAERLSQALHIAEHAKKLTPTPLPTEAQAQATTRFALT